MSDDVTHIDPHWLQKLPQFTGYSTEAIQEIASKTVIEEAPSGRRLFIQGQNDHWCFYLIEGGITLTAPLTPAQAFHATDPAALSPLAPTLPRRVTALTTSPVRFIRIDNNLLDILQPKASQQGIEVGEIEAKADTLEEQMFYQFYQDYMQDKMKLPSLPDIAVRVRNAVQNPDNGPNEVAKIIQADAGLTTRLLQAANSAMYGGNANISTLRMAVTRLGMEATRNIATSFALQQLFTSKSKLLRDELMNIWKHSARVAAISFILAKRTPGIEPDRALLAGLIHDIGALPIINHAEHFTQLMIQPAKLHGIIHKLKPQIGAMILRKWKLPTDLVTATLEPENWGRDPDKIADLCDIVLVAQVHSYIGTPAFLQCPRLDEIPAFQKIAMGKLTPETSKNILEESREEIRQMVQILGG